MKSTLKILVFSCLLYLSLQNAFQCNVAGCQYCSFPNNCGLCQNNYVLSLNATNGLLYCSPVTCPANCQTCFQNNVCQNCSSGFYITSNGTCASQQTSNSSIPPFCLWGTNSQNCTLCQYGYSQQAGQCYLIIDQNMFSRNLGYDNACQIKLNPMICQICQSGNFVGPLGKCISLTINQQTCSIQNCLYCTNSNNTCSVCATGYQLTSSNTCTQNTCNTPNCVACGSNGLCNRCSIGYNLVTSNSTCQQVGYGCTVPNCASCSGPQTCGKCQDGYVPTPYSQKGQTFYLCKKLACPYTIQNCQTCVTNFNDLLNFNQVVCSLCNSGYILVNGYCVAQITTYTCSNVTNCQQCSYTNFCSLCNIGFSLTTSGTCVPTQCNVPNCAACNVNNVCSQCNAGFALNVAGLPSAWYNAENFGNFVLNSCVPNNITCNITGCAYCNSNNVCASCIQGYDFSAQNPNQCVPTCTVSNCFQCVESNQNICNICVPGFSVSSTGQCNYISGSNSCGSNCANSSCIYNYQYQTPECLSCNPPNILYNRQCYSPTGCNIYGCTLCQPGFFITVCLQCSQGLVLNGNQCMKLNCNNGVPNCLYCIQNGACLGCAQGFMLSNATGTPSCVAQGSISACNVQNCLTCQVGNPNMCQTCAKPYTQKNGICVCGFQNCLQCNTNSFSCDSCPAPLFTWLNTQGCIPSPLPKQTCSVANCRYCLSNTQCSICAEGFSLNSTDYSCFQNNCSTLSNCQLCDQIAYVCHLCQAGFMMNDIYDGGQCVPINANYTCNISGCAVCSSNNNSQCTTCLPTYTANGSTQCVPNSCNIANCYLCFQNSVCTVCLSGFYLTTNLTCLPLYSNVNNCGTQIPFCLMCVTGLLSNSTGPYCVQCQDGFQYDTVNNVCRPQTNTIPNCKIQTTSQSTYVTVPPMCTVCAQGYYPNAYGQCVQYGPNVTNTGCSVYNCLYCGTNNSTCSFCLAPWGISSTGQCQATQFCSANCQFCANATVCLTCATSYSVNSTGACVLCQVASCQTCQTANTCSTCLPGFSLTSNNSCMSCNVQNCASCSSNNICASCKMVNGAQYFPTPTGGGCVLCNTNLANMANCVSCNQDNSCGLCQNGYQLYQQANGSSVCLNCSIANCQSCALNQTGSVVCGTCAVGYSPVQNVCTQCLYPCVTCQNSTTSNVCATCSTPFYFETATSSGQCIANLIPFCISYNTTNTSLCANCSSGYSLNYTSNTCQFNCPNNCQTCSNNATCTQCVSGTFLNANGTCVQCQVTGCSVCSADGSTCLTCFQGFYNVSGQCKICPGYCSQCTSANSCQALAQTKQQVLVQINGQSVLAVCQQNCVTCSNLNPQICLQCANGFFLSQGNCLQCSSNCLTCQANSTSTCLSCYPNWFLSSGTCVNCNSNCMTCLNANSPAVCTSCYDGFYLSNSTCIQGCPLNCFSCSNPTTCTQCLSGYTLFTQSSQTICAPCVTSCRTCAQGQPAACLSCGPGFYLSGTTCTPCSVNCNSCTAAGCISCIDGYFLTSAQTCAQNCQLPCATCTSINPTQCLSCVAGYNYQDSSNTCNQNLACSGGCTVCPLNYALSQGQCVQCTSPQCQTCNPSSPSTCYSCLPGFFLNQNTNQCQACAASCATCLTGTGCTTCATGFTRIKNVPMSAGGYQCVPCNSPCATCVNTPNYCTSCISGYDFVGWKCAQTFYFGFGLTLNTNMTVFNQNYFSFISALANAIGASTPNAITITSIAPGSVIVNGGAAPSGSSGSKQANGEYSSLDSALSSNNQIAGMPIVSSSVSVVGGSVDFKQVNLALILGICIPVGLLLISGIAVYIYCKKKKSADVIEQKIKEDSGFTVRESFSLSGPYKEEDTGRPFEETTGIN